VPVPVCVSVSVSHMVCVCVRACLCAFECMRAEQASCSSKGYPTTLDIKP